MKTKQERSAIFKSFQANIGKKDTFDEGKRGLLELRAEFAVICDLVFDTCDAEDFCKMPFAKDKTMAYYLFHLARIEDIVTNVLIADGEQLFFSQGFDASLKSPIATTGNELIRDELVDFSKELDIGQLKKYYKAVMLNTNKIIHNMSFEESKAKVSAEKKGKLVASNAVSADPNAFWLVDYWCRKTYAGLMLMPLSRHHMVHLGSGCLRITDKIKFTKHYS